MKRLFSLLLALSLLLGLSACGKSPEAQDTQPEANPLVAADGSWLGEGGCYTLRPADLPADASPFLLGDEMFYLIQSDENRCLMRGDQVICRFSETGWPLGVGVSGDTLWVAEEYQDEDRNVDARYLHLSPAGEVLDTLSFRDIYPTEDWLRDFDCDGDRLYQMTGEELVAFTRDGQLVGSVPLPDRGCDLLITGIGPLLAFQQEEGLTLCSPDFQAKRCEPLFTVPDGSLFPGGQESPLLLKTDEGLYRVSESGELSPVVLWKECDIAASGLHTLLPLSDGRYFCVFGFMGIAKLLVPAEPSELHPRKMLRMAGVASDALADQEILAYNLWSENYYIEYTNYTEGDSIPLDQALLKLNTEILSGNCPDLLFLPRLSPYPYIGKGLIRDLTPFFDEDPEIGTEDLVALKALQYQGGIYYMGSTFSLETRVGRESDFGDTFGWSIQQYLDFEQKLPEDVWTMYNITAEYFLRTLSSRYSRTAINWAEGSCDFDNPEFISILEAAKRIRENPEDPNNMRFGNGVVWVAEGSMLVDMVMMQEFTRWAEDEAVAGCRLSVVGEPTPDGSCGTDLGISGVCMLVSSDSPEGCWEFIKYRLTHPYDYPIGLCLYRPVLERRMEAAVSDPQLRFTAEDRDRFLRLLDAIQYPNFYDPMVLSVIEEESGAFLAGERSAADTARLIQSRLSLYVSEQS